MSIINFICRIVAESIPWLMANGKRDKAEAVMREALKYNGKPLPEDDIFPMPLNIYLGEKGEKENSGDETTKSACDKVKDCMSCDEGFKLRDCFKRGKKPDKTEQADVKKYSVLDLFKSRVLLRYTLASFVVW